jgi:AcrR family transcriptional regulator
MTTTKSREPDRPDSREAISALTDQWLRQFLKNLELPLLDTSCVPATDASIAESIDAAARAILATSLDSGTELESVAELLGRAALEHRIADAAWSDALNQRRFALIDREIQGSLTPAESIELAGLTHMMRDHVESESNLPTAGARALHRNLLQLGSTGEPD